MWLWEAVNLKNFFCIWKCFFFEFPTMIGCNFNTINNLFSIFFFFLVWKWGYSFVISLVLFYWLELAAKRSYWVIVVLKTFEDFEISISGRESILIKIHSLTFRSILTIISEQKAIKYSMVAVNICGKPYKSQIIHSPSYRPSTATIWLITFCSLSPSLQALSVSTSNFTKSLSSIPTALLTIKFSKSFPSYTLHSTSFHYNISCLGNLWCSW